MFTFYHFLPALKCRGCVTFSVDLFSCGARDNGRGDVRMRPLEQNVPGLGSEFCVTVLISSESSWVRSSRPLLPLSCTGFCLPRWLCPMVTMVPGWQLVALTRRCSQESLLPAAALLSPEPRMLGSRTREQCLPSIHCTHCAGQVSTVLYYRPGLSVLTASINRAQRCPQLKMGLKQKLY